MFETWEQLNSYLQANPLNVRVYRESMKLDGNDCIYYYSSGTTPIRADNKSMINATNVVIQVFTTTLKNRDILVEYINSRLNASTDFTRDRDNGDFIATLRKQMFITYE